MVILFFNQRLKLYINWDTQPEIQNLNGVKPVMITKMMSMNVYMVIPDESTKVKSTKNPGIRKNMPTT